MTPRPVPPARTLCCPICGRELGVEPRQRGIPWTPRQHWLLTKMAALGFSRKVMGNVFGIEANTVGRYLFAARRAGGREV